MAHAQKPDFVFRRNGRVHLNRRGASVQSTTGSRGVRISGSNAGYTMFRGSMKSTGYPLHSPVSPSFPLLCVTECHHISTVLPIVTVWDPRMHYKFWYIGSVLWKVWWWLNRVETCCYKNILCTKLLCLTGIYTLYELDEHIGRTNVTLK